MALSLRRLEAAGASTWGLVGGMEGETARSAAAHELRAYDEEREEEGADQSEKSAWPCRNSTVPRIAALRAHHLVRGG